MSTTDSGRERAARSPVRRPALPVDKLAGRNRAATYRAARRTDALVRDWLKQLKATRQL